MIEIIWENTELGKIEKLAKDITGKNLNMNCLIEIRQLIVEKSTLNRY
jgi:hypothetical protein